MIASPNHNGDVTHHHDQSATAPISANLSTRNTMNTNADNEIVPFFIVLMI